MRLKLPKLKIPKPDIPDQITIRKPRTPLGWFLVGVLAFFLITCASDWLMQTVRQTGERLGMLPTPTVTASATPAVSPTPTRPTATPTRLQFVTPTREPSLTRPSRTARSAQQRQTATAIAALELTAIAERNTPTRQRPTRPPPPVAIVPATSTAVAVASPAPATPTAIVIAPVVPRPTAVPVQPVVPVASPTIAARSTEPPSFPVVSPTPVTPTAPPYIPAANPALPLQAPSLNECQPDAVSHMVPNYPVRIYLVDKETEVFTLENMGPDAVNLNGWKLCSISGNEQFAFNEDQGMLLPGQKRGFVYARGNVWEQCAQDDAALYNAQGQLISYWSDPLWTSPKRVCP